MRGSDNFQEMLLISGMRDDANATGFKIKRNLSIFLMDYIHLRVEDKPFSLIRFDGVLLVTAKVDTFQDLPGDSGMLFRMNVYGLRPDGQFNFTRIYAFVRKVQG